MSATSRSGGVRMLMLCALLLGSATACDNRYSHGRIKVDEDTKRRWNAGEREAEDAGKRIIPVADANEQDSMVPRDSLKNALTHVFPSRRHGAEDKRLLSDPQEASLSSGIVAKIVLVQGSEYKSLDDYQKGWIPVAIVYRPLAEGRSQRVYEELNLQPAETSWVFVRRLKNSTWQGSIVSPDRGDYRQGRLTVTTERMAERKSGARDSLETDLLEPVIGARFVWDGKDESIWAYCGGVCCQMKK